MWLSRPTSSGSGGHLSGGQLTGSSPRAAAGADRCAGPVVDAGVGHGGGDRTGRPAGRDRPVGRGDRADQAAPPRAYRRAAAGRDRRRAAGRGRLPGRAGPPARRHRRAAVGPGAGIWRRRPRPGWPAVVGRAVAAVETGLGDVAAAALAAAARRAGGGAVRAGDDRPGHHRCGGLRPPQARGGVQPPRPAGRAPARGDAGPTPRRCWPRTCWPATRTPAATPPRCCAGRWPRCRPRRGPGGSGCAPTPATSPEQLARAALFADIEFAIGARRIAPLWRLLDGLDRGRLDRRDRHARRAGRGGRLLPELVARRDPAADPPGPPRRRRPGRSARIRGRGGAAPCTPTSAPCPCPNSPRSPTPTPSTATRSS